jgi:leucine dehydrogenase
LGATINDETINKIKARVIAGAANNQLAEQIHGKILKEKGIAYAPDFLINAGGIINVYAEIVGYDKAEAMRRTENIYNTTLEIFSFAEEKGITTHQAALSIAEKRIEDRKKKTPNNRAFRLYSYFCGAKVISFRPVNIFKSSYRC